MIIEITKPKFKSIINNKSLNLPKRWDGVDFYSTISSLFHEYLELLSLYITSKDKKKVQTICNDILKCIDQYYNGFPNEAFKQMRFVMKKLIEHPLTIYKKSGWTGAFNGQDPLMLFRIRNVQNNMIYNRKDIFHTPYNLRSKVATFRFSMSGYPSLYLGTSLKLCCEEVKIDSFSDLTIASRYKINREMCNNNDTQIDVLELALKPKDFLSCRETNINFDCLENEYRRRQFNEIELDDIQVMSKYLYWYPLIAACSYIRVNKNDPFASEYIVPQLLMQWVRTQSDNNKLIGIRYFSCASEHASELGFNYVFPVSGNKYSGNDKYCNILANSFLLTSPVYIHEFDSINSCERFLIKSSDADFDKI